MSRKDKYQATKSSYTTATQATNVDNSISQARKETRQSGKISNNLVDPSSYHGLRSSRTRFDEHPSGLFRLVKGIPMTLSTYVDGSSSFGDALVKQTFKGLEKAFEICSKVMPQYELWTLSGLFNDLSDGQFPLYRSQFEYDPVKIIEQLTSCIANDGGGNNGGEDSQYAIFAEAYLSQRTIDLYGLKGYAFFISDEPMHDRFLSADTPKKIFGDKVFETIQANGFPEINEHNIPTVQQAIAQMLRTNHAFYIGLGSDWTRDNAGRNALQCWSEMLGSDRVIPLYGMSGDVIPYVQGIVCGLTEGTLSLVDVPIALAENGVAEANISQITRAVANIPMGAQAELIKQLPHPLPKADDLFRTKTDLWPVDQSEIPEETPEDPVWV